MDISCLRSQLTTAIYENIIPHVLWTLQYIDYLIDHFAFILEILLTLLFTIILGLSIGLQRLAFYFWDSYMEYTKRKHYIQEGIRYDILFYENTNNVMGNVYLFYNIKSSKI